MGPTAAWLISMAPSSSVPAPARSPPGCHRRPARFGHKGLRDEGHAAAVTAGTAVLRRRREHGDDRGRVPTSREEWAVKRWSLGPWPEGVWCWWT
jgi:hypothetical protein